MSLQTCPACLNGVKDPPPAAPEAGSGPSPMPVLQRESDDLCGCSVSGQAELPDLGDLPVGPVCELDSIDDLPVAGCSGSCGVAQRLAARGETPHDASLGPFADGRVAETCSTPSTAAFQRLALDGKSCARRRDGFHHGLLARGFPSKDGKQYVGVKTENEMENPSLQTCPTCRSGAAGPAPEVGVRGLVRWLGGYVENPTTYAVVRFLVRLGCLIWEIYP